MYDSLERAPKLWFNQHILRFDGRCEDCPGACPDSMISTMHYSSAKLFEREINAGSIRNICLNHNTFLKHFGKHTVAMNSRGRGIVLLDTKASGLLSYLSSPCTLKDLRTIFSEWPSQIFDRTISLLLALNILSSSQSLDIKVSQNESETLTAWIHLTNQCNLLCKYCYVVKNGQQMGTSLAQRSVDAVFRSALIHGHSRVKLKYSGGEPTLNFDALQVAQRRAEELSTQTGIELESVLLTNGTHMTNVLVDSLLAHNIRVMVSLDGINKHQDTQRPQANHGISSFKSVTHTLDRFFDKGISPHISITITKQTLNGLPDLVEYLLDRQLRFSFNFYREIDSSLEPDPLAFTSGEMIEGLRQAFQAIKKRLPQYTLLSSLADRVELQVPHLHTCGVGLNYLVIGCNGNVFKCQMDMRSPITTIEVSDPLGQVRTDCKGIQNLSVDQKKECRGCIWRYHCTGGCSRLTFQRTRRYNAKSPLCEIYQAILPEIVCLEGMRLLKYEKPWNFSFLQSTVAKHLSRGY